MKYDLPYNTENNYNITSRLSYRISSDNSKHKGITVISKGQQISGKVVSIDDNNRVTLNINGKNIFADMNIFGTVQVGDIKTFGVINATSKMIELRLVGENNSMSRNGITAVLRVNSDQELFMARKEQAEQTAKQQKEISDTIKKLSEITSKLNSKDYMALEQEGFLPEDLTVDGLYSAMNRAKDSNSGWKTQQKDDRNPYETGKENSKIDTDTIEKRLKEEGLPSSSDYVNSVAAALRQSGIISKMDDKTMKYLISQEMEPTIGNIYKAYYSQNTQLQTQDNSQSQSISEDAWKELLPQVKGVIQGAGYEVNEDNLKNAKWLIENNLPLTAQSLTYKNELDGLKQNSGENQVFDQIVEGMKKGTAPQAAQLSNTDGTSYDQVIEDIRSITDDTIENAVENDVDLTINNLKSIQESSSSQSSTAAAASKGSEKSAASEKSSASENSKAKETQTEDKNLLYEQTKAKRQLEEIRLKMTAEAAAKLEKKGFHIETEPLEKVVEELRNQEDSYYKELLSEAGAQASDENVAALKNTAISMEQLKYAPSYILGSTLSQRSTQTIATLLSEGTSMSAQLMKAGQAYDSLMTMPNAEYGDSIQKAFNNMDSLLSEMNIDNTQANQRAVKILGYNQMDINQESIDKVKAYDLEVNTLIKNLNPAVTARLIKDGINPLDMPIKDLNEMIDHLKEEQGVSTEDKFSTYLMKLEKDNSISAEERKGYIGIYRLLYQVDKTDGAALGSLIKSNQEVTLNNLLSAVKTIKKGRVNQAVDDSFGTLQSKSYSKETISEQLSSAFSGQDGTQDNFSQSDKYGNLSGEQTEYLKRMLKLMKEDINPQQLKQLQTEASQQASQTDRASISQLTQQLTAEQGIWDSIKDIPVEKMFESFYSQIQKNEINEKAYADKVKNLKESIKNTDQAVRFLNDFKIAATPANLMQMSQILNNGDTPLKKYIKEQKDKKKDNKDENSQTPLKEIEDLSDKLIDKTSMQEAYENLEADARDTLEQNMSKEDIDSIQLSEHKSIGAQLSLLKTLSGKEFYQIPIETENGVTNINLTILHNSEASGKVSAVIQSDQLGTVKADFSLKDQDLKGYIRCDNRESLDIMQNHLDDIESVAQEEDINLSQVDFGLQSKGQEVYDYSRSGETDNEVNPDTERILYRIAKAMVQSVRKAELSEVNGNAAVS